MSSASTHWTIIQRAAQGVPEDQSEFARRYGPVIRATLGARWRGTPLFDHTDDAAQQVFLECFKGALERADPERQFRGYLYGVVKNVALMVERKRARTKERQTTSSLDLEAIASHEDSCATAFDREWALALMRDAAELQLDRARELGPEAVRRHRLLALRYGENLPIREIAARWQIDASVLHREYPKAKDEFKRALMDVVRDLQGTHGVAEECSRLLGHFS